MLSQKAKSGFFYTLQLGCSMKFLPYKWNSFFKQLTPPSSLHLKIFHFHKNLMYSYTLFMVLRLIQASKSSGHFPLQQKILSASWTNAFVITSVGFFQLELRQVEIMHFANRLLALTQGISQLGKNDYATSFPKTHHIENCEKDKRSWHVYLALFLLYTNPGVHSLIQYESPCAPNYVSSAVFPCRTIGENMYTFAEKSPFVVLELYAISMFLYICCFHWSFILIGLSQVATELRKMQHVTVEVLSRFGRWYSIHNRYRQLELLVITVNDIFHYYLMVFPSVLLSIVSLLMFGTIRLWHVSPQSNLMFPVCGLRCGFEAVSPLAMAGNVNKASKQVLGQWKQLTHHVLRKQHSRIERRIFKMVQRSCRRIQCTAANFEYAGDFWEKLLTI